MNRIYFFLIGIVCVISSCNSPNKTATATSATEEKQEISTNTPPAPTTSGYDSVLAKRLGADDYGMRKYVMAFLKKGPNRPTDPKEATSLQAQHMENINRLAEAGKLSLAGPFLDDGELRGIYIFNVETIAEAEALTNTDPAIQAGSLVMELHPWYGSAALIDVNNIHNKISK